MDSPGTFQQPVCTPVGSPLRQLSADQMNQPRMLPQSPSLPNFANENDRSNCHRSRESISSDVRSKVDFLNSLSNPSSPTKSGRPTFALPQAPTNAALQRAVLGFEESQASLASATAEIERLKEQLKSGKQRERMVSERIESLMGQLSTERESRNNDKKYYVTEVKKCRKQAYQAELSQLETQEALKEIKQELRRAQAEVAAERKKKEDARQEAFERAYAVSGLSEELETLRATLRATQNERDAAAVELQRTPARQLALIATEERAVQTSPEAYATTLPEDVPLPNASLGEDLQYVPATQISAETFLPGKLVSQAAEPLWSEFVARDQCLRDLYDEPFTYEDHIHALYQEVQATRDEVVRQHDQINYMYLQCQNGSCECKRAEKRGERYIYDQAFEDFCQERSRKKRKLTQEHKARPLPPLPPSQTGDAQVDPSIAEHAASIPLPSPVEHEFALRSQDPSPEPTAVLEELTQVMVESGNEGRGTAPFTFSTSVSAHAQEYGTAPVFNVPQDPSNVPDLDMFDMSLARDHPPPRPSTAMGILSVPSPERSPIRLVPDSPDVRSLPPDSVIRDSERLAYTSSTTRIALKDSPAQDHRRAQSRPNVRSHSRGRSPLFRTETHEAPSFDKAASASPAASTIFPITPMTKNTHLRYDAQQTVTTTTTVPLRGIEDDSTLSSCQNENNAASSSNHFHDQAAASAHHAQMLSGITGTPVSRDAALAQIRARRDRARSLNMKKMDGGGGSKTPGSARRGIQLKEGVVGGIGGVGRDRDVRDVSVTSVQTAPGRF